MHNCISSNVPVASMCVQITLPVSEFGPLTCGFRKVMEKNRTQTLANARPYINPRICLSPIPRTIYFLVKRTKKLRWTTLVTQDHNASQTVNHHLTRHNRRKFAATRVCDRPVQVAQCVLHLGRYRAMVRHKWSTLVVGVWEKITSLNGGFI